MTNLSFDADQADAVALLREAREAVITGPPGVGKTTCTRAALDALDESRRRYELCAPTGKAAKRLSEATGRPAQTIHRLLEWSRGRFQRNQFNPLSVDLVVCDESSMIDLPLAADLLDACGAGTRVVFVGDAHQLPPVGPGMFFRDLIASAAVPVVELRTLHRAAEASWIYRNAPRVLRGGQNVELDDCADFEWHCLDAGLDPGAIGDTVVSLVERLRAEGAAADDFQVLSPMRVRRGGCGELNQLLQASSPGAGTKRSTYIGYGDRMAQVQVGDRVIQTRNDYELGVFNGDVGEVSDVAARGLTVRFGDTHIAYGDQQRSGLELAYALTIHKFQGSEVRDVIVVCHSCHGSMLTRQLIYTALTRARRRVFLVGDVAGWRTAMARNQVLQRRTQLAERLRASCGDG